MRQGDSPRHRGAHRATAEDNEHDPGGHGKKGSERKAGDEAGAWQRDPSRSRLGKARSRSSDTRRRRSRSPDTRRRRSRSPDTRRRRSRDGHRDRGHRRDRASNKTSQRDTSREEDSDNARRERKRQSEARSRGSGPRARSPGRRDEGEAAQSQATVKRSGPLPSQADSFALVEGGNGDGIDKPKEQPNFGSSGLLAAASNSVAQADGTTVTLKYHEPPEARKPPAKDQWKLFVFKGAAIVDTVELSLRSCWLVGRETAVADLPAEHPSISKQHAVIQFRHTEKRNEFGDKIGRVKPYLIDLESANGTMLNSEKIPDSRYLELRDKDMIQFGSSTREYVLMLAPRD